MSETTEFLKIALFCAVPFIALFVLWGAELYSDKRVKKKDRIKDLELRLRELEKKKG